MLSFRLSQKLKLTCGFNPTQVFVFNRKVTYLSRLWVLEFDFYISNCAMGHLAGHLWFWMIFLLGESKSNLTLTKRQNNCLVFQEVRVCVRVCMCVCVRVCVCLSYYGVHLYWLWSKTLHIIRSSLEESTVKCYVFLHYYYFKIKTINENSTMPHLHTRSCPGKYLFLNV